MHITCIRCDCNKPSSAFSRSGKSKYKPGQRSYYQSYCKSCTLEVGNAWRNKNKEKLNATVRAKAVSPQQRLKYLVNAKGREQLDYDTLWARLEEQQFACAVTGIPFEYTPRQPRALSIDRIDPSNGYTHDNVRLVCWWLNTAMGNWGLTTLKDMIQQWERNNVKQL